MTYKNASYASWPDDRRHTTAKFEGEGDERARGQTEVNAYFYAVVANVEMALYSSSLH